MGHLQRADAGFVDRIARSDNRSNYFADDCLIERSRGFEPTLLGRHWILAGLDSLHAALGKVG